MRDATERTVDARDVLDIREVVESADTLPVMDLGILKRMRHYYFLI